MLVPFLIMLREGIEAALIVGIIASYLKRTGRGAWMPAVWLGIFLALAGPWHILAALRNPSITMPPGLGLPAKAGWAWFYLYNEHFARFLGKRIPHDYGNTPVWLFWLYLAIWLFPWMTFLPGNARTWRQSRARSN